MFFRKDARQPRSIVITGGSDGIGKALAMNMAKRGFNVAITARRLSVLEDVKRDIENQCPDVKVVARALDVQDFDQIEPVLRDLQKDLGTIDILVANAGIARTAKVGVDPDDSHIDTINTNVNGAIKTVCVGVRIFKEQGFGHIVGTSSVAAFRGMPRNAAYSASKAAFSTFLEGLRAELVGENIDITVLHPGFIDTAINRNMRFRPFVIDVESGADKFAKLILKKVERAEVPKLPWSIIAPVISKLPTAVIAKM